MQSVEVTRAKWDDIYNKYVTKIIGCVLTFIGFSEILKVGPLSEEICLPIAFACAAFYLLSPGFTLFLFSLLFFICTAHINPMASLLVSVLILPFCGRDYFSCMLITILPTLFTIGTVGVSLYWCVFILFLYFSIKMNYHIGFGITFSLLFSILVLMFEKHGTVSMFYDTPMVWEKTAATNADTFFTSFNFEYDFEFMMQNLTPITLFVVIAAVFAILVSLIFSKSNILNKPFDVADAIVFLICCVLIAVFQAIIVFGLKLHFDLSDFTAAIFAPIIAYIFSRPFASKGVIKTFYTTAQLEDKKTYADNFETEKSSASWDVIAGYENTKKEIRETIKPYVDKNEYKRMIQANMKPIKGILLFGPPGTGKTTMVRAIANETKMDLLLVSAGEFINKYVGESEKRLREIFNKARESKPCLICFDEIESFLYDRKNAKEGFEKNIINTFLSQMDGYNELEDVLVIGTTNKPELIDSAALRPGRFDKIIYVGAPDEKSRDSLFKKYLIGKADISNINFEKLVEKSERYTGADIKGICEEVYRKNGYKEINENDVLHQLQKIRPSFTLDMKEEYYLWNKKYNRSDLSSEDNKTKTSKSLSWDDIKGMDELKKILKQKIENPIKNIEKYKEYNVSMAKGILFFGPPGCGKTFFAKVVSDECDTAFYTVNGPELLSGKTGESEAKLRNIFRNARETKPSIIFFDEIDAIATKRESSTDNVRLINQLLTELDGMESLDGVLVIAATNRPETLDTALLRAGRFDTKIYIGMPDKAARKELLESALNKIPSEIDYNECADLLSDFTCADIVAICNKLKEFFMQRSIDLGDEIPLVREDFLSIKERMRPSLSKEEISRYEDMKIHQSII